MAHALLTHVARNDLRREAGILEEAPAGFGGGGEDHPAGHREEVRSGAG
jgi:hypothetical protein